MSYRTALAANAILISAKRHRIRLEPHKLQQLLFLLQGWHLAKFHAPAVDERPQAWDSGPIFESLYFRLMAYGASGITHLLRAFHPPINELCTLFPSQEDIEYWRMLDDIVAEYGRWSGNDLLMLCTEPGGAWESAKSEGQLIISDESVKLFFERKFDEYASFIREASPGVEPTGPVEGLLLPWRA